MNAWILLVIIAAGLMGFGSIFERPLLVVIGGLIFIAAVGGAIITMQPGA